jgi:hypothetical protein
LAHIAKRHRFTSGLLLLGHRELATALLVLREEIFIEAFKFHGAINPDAYIVFDHQVCKPLPIGSPAMLKPLYRPRWGEGLAS